MSDHARFSPSGASRWLACPGSIGMEEGLPDSDNDFSAEGTAAHDLASRVLQAQVDGDFTDQGDVLTHIDTTIKVGERTFTVDQAMAEHVQTYVDACMITSRDPGMIREVEQRVYFGAYIGAPDEEAFGTVDFGYLDPAKGEIGISDFKYGMGVQVFAENNEQMMLYALGYLAKYEMVGEFHTAHLTIHQPRLDHHDPWVNVPVVDLLAFAERCKSVVAIINGAPWSKEDWPTEFASDTGPIVPSAKSCQFCKAAKRTQDGELICPALRAEAKSVVAITASVDDFADLTVIPSLSSVKNERLGLAMDKVWILEEMATAIRAEVERRLLSDEPVPSPEGGYKLVTGKRGNRAWQDEDAVEKLLKSFRVKNEHMYSFKLLGPAPIEKLLAKAFPRRWAKLVKLYGQADGKISVAPMSDGRPAITRTAVLDAFDDVSAEAGADDLVS